MALDLDEVRARGREASPDTRAELLAFIEDAYSRGLSRDQVADALVERGYTVTQILDAIHTEHNEKRPGRRWKVMSDAELLEFLKRRERNQRRRKKAPA
jgi:hypothetical protein